MTTASHKLTAKRLDRLERSVTARGPLTRHDALRLIATVREMDRALENIEAHLLDWYGESKIVEFARAARLAR